MRIEIHLLARLLRIPLLRVEGVVDIHDGVGAGAGGHGTIEVTRSGRPVELRGPSRVDLSAPVLPVGRDLAAAEAIISSLGRAERRESRS
jgi:hypothetical protein